MEQGSLTWRLAMFGAGALLAGFIGGGLQAAGVRDLFAIVVAMAVAVGPMADGLNPESAAATLEGRLRQSVAATLGGLLVGFFVAILLLLTSFTGSIAMGAAAGMTYVAGLAVRGLAGRSQPPE